MATLTPEQFKQKYGEQTLQQFGQPLKQPGYFQRVGQSLKETFTGLKTGLETQAETIAREGLEEDPSRLKQATALGRGALRTTGAVARTALTPLTEAPGIKQGLEFVGEKLAGTAPIQKYTEWTQRHPEAAKDIEDVLDIAALFGGKAIKEPIGIGVKAGAKATKETIETGIKTGVQTGKQLVGKGKEALKPPTPIPQKAMGQILQGQAKDIKTGFRALKEVDTAGVKTYSELSSKVNTSITNLSAKVDEVLDKTTPVSLNELKLTGKTAVGQKISIDYVSRAIEHLKELYKSTGDDIAYQNMVDTLNRTKIIGLTRLEVNNLSRQYGIEFGEKAFSKMGEPLTSVNAVKFETTRKMLKEVARKGIKGKQAEAIDKSISSLYRVKDLVKKNVEAVNKLQQKIQERGLLEKVGYYTAKYTDILTGGTLRGVMGGLLPRGVGYKVMNALDLEQVLQRNLDIITKALKSGDKEIIDLLKTKSRLLP